MTEFQVKTGSGDGLVARYGDGVLFVPNADERTDGLVSVFRESASEEVFADVAAYVVEAGFDAPAFALVVVGDGSVAMRVFGDLEMTTDFPSVPMLSGKGSGTWVDHTASTDVGNFLSTGVEPDHRTDLGVGVVIAGGVQLVVGEVPEPEEIEDLPEDTFEEPPMSEVEPVEAVAFTETEPEMPAIADEVPVVAEAPLLDAPVMDAPVMDAPVMDAPVMAEGPILAPVDEASDEMFDTVEEQPTDSWILGSATTATEGFAEPSSEQSPEVSSDENMSQEAEVSQAELQPEDSSSQMDPAGWLALSRAGSESSSELVEGAEAFVGMNESPAEAEFSPPPPGYLPDTQIPPAVEEVAVEEVAVAEAPSPGAAPGWATTELNNPVGLTVPAFTPAAAQVGTLDTPAPPIPPPPGSGSDAGFVPQPPAPAAFGSSNPIPAPPAGWSDRRAGGDDTLNPDSPPAAPGSDRRATFVLHLDDGTSYPVDAPLVFGRKPSVEGDQKAVKLRGDQISRTHLVVQMVDGALWIQDSGSRNGSAVIPVDTGEPQTLEGNPYVASFGDRVFFGSRSFLVEKISD